MLRQTVFGVVCHRLWTLGGGREKNVPTNATRIVLHNTASKMSVAIFTFGLGTIDHGEIKVRTNSAFFM